MSACGGVCQQCNIVYSVMIQSVLAVRRPDSVLESVSESPSVDRSVR